MDYSQAAWMYAGRGQKTPTEADRNSHFGQTSFTFPSLSANQLDQTNASTDITAKMDEDPVDPLTAFLNPGSSGGLAQQQQDQQQSGMQYSQQTSYSSNNYTHVGSNSLAIANLLGPSSPFNTRPNAGPLSGTTSPVTTMAANYSTSLGIGLPLPHPSASVTGGMQQQQMPYGGDYSSASQQQQQQEQPESSALQRSTSAGNFAHLLANHEPDQLSWQHQRHYSYGNVPYGAAAGRPGGPQLLLPPFNVSYDDSSPGEASGSKEKPSLSLLTDTGTLTGGWDSTQASAVSYTSAASYVGPELTFSADPTTTTDTSFANSTGERLDSFADSLHPDSAIDAYGKRSYHDYRGRETSPLSAASDNRSRQPSPFASPYEEFPSITIRQPAENLAAPFSGQPTAFHDIQPSPATRYIHPVVRRTPSSTSVSNTLPMSSQGLPSAQSRDSPLVPRMASFGLRDLNNVSPAAAEAQSWARLLSRPDLEIDVQALLRWVL